jgi:hypothetical protein
MGHLTEEMNRRLDRVLHGEPADPEPPPPTFIEDLPFTQAPPHLADDSYVDVNGLPYGSRTADAVEARRQEQAAKSREAEQKARAAEARAANPLPFTVAEHEQRLAGLERRLAALEGKAS